MTKIDDKLRILLISPLPPPAGGIATWTKLFINSSQSKRHVVDVVNTSIIGERGNVFWKKNLLNELKRNILIFYEAKSKIKKIPYSSYQFFMFNVWYDKRLPMCKDCKKIKTKSSCPFSL